MEEVKKRVGAGSMCKKLVLLVMLVVIVIGGVHFYRDQTGWVDYEDKTLPARYTILDVQESWKSKPIDYEDGATDIILSSPAGEPVMLKYNTQNTSFPLSNFGSDFYCGDKKANIIEYKSNHPASWNKLSGGWDEIKVIDCDRYYFIKEEWGPPQMFGPFELIS